MDRPVQKVYKLAIKFFDDIRCKFAKKAQFPEESNYHSLVESRVDVVNVIFSWIVHFFVIMVLY